MFFFNWTTLVIRNIIHGTVSSVMGMHFLNAIPKERSPKKFVITIKNPSVKSLAYTFRAFGTICFKSVLMVPIPLGWTLNADVNFAI